MELLERESQLDALTAYADEARSGQARLVLLGGEAGVGKTTLVEQLRTRVPAANWAWGSCDGLFTPRPLSPLFDVAGQLGGPLQQACERDAARDVLFDEFVRTLSTAPELTVVVIEDLHWADAASLDLIRHAWRRLGAARALIVVTYRDDALAADTLLRTTLGDLATYRGTRRLELAALTLAAVTRLAADTPLAPEALYRLTGGNPFFVGEVLSGAGQQLPPSARDAVLARTGRLDDAARSALETVSLFRTQAEPTQLLRLASVTSAGLDGCVASGLLVARGNALSFRHDIARLAIAAEIAPHRRAVLHAQILATLQALGHADDAELAHHADEAGDRDAMVQYAPRAARAAAAAASHREAAFQYARALRGLPEAKTAERARLCAALSDEVARLDRWEECLQARQEALDIWRSLGDEVRAGDAQRRLIGPLWRLCRGAELNRAAADAVRLLERRPPGPELADAWLVLAGVEAESLGNLDEAFALTYRAHALAIQLDLEDVMVSCLATEAGLVFAAGLDGAVERYHEAHELAVALGDESSAGWITSNLYATLVGARRLAEAERVYLDGIAYCDARDLVAYSACLHGERCRSLAHQGRIAEGLELTATLLGQTGPSPVNRLNPLIVDGLLYARVGDRATAEAALDEALALADTVGEHYWTVRTRLARAELAWLDGRDADARVEVGRAGAAMSGLDPWQTGDALVWSHRFAAGLTLEATAARPHQLEVRGDHAGAAAEWDRLGSAYDSAMALAFSADADEVRAAHDRFVEMGADGAATRLRRRLKELGARVVPVGPRSATKQHPAGLTRREAEILELLVEGRTNAEVAGALFLSERTVDHHVSAILRKLKVGSRTQAARQARLLGLVSV